VLVISSSLKNGWTWHAAQFAIPFKNVSLEHRSLGSESHCNTASNVLPYSPDFNLDLPGGESQLTLRTGAEKTPVH
jgi:hypothetical protein